MMRSLLVLTLLASACGDNVAGPVAYTSPKAGKLRLIRSQTPSTSIDEVVLDFIVGDQPLTGYSVGFNLPVGHELVRLDEFIPGSALSPGSSPAAARGALPTEGPLADTLVAGLSQKASGTGAVTTDTTVGPYSVLFTIRLRVNADAPAGVVFDGTAADFHLPSGGMRDRSGTTVVEATDVAIGKLEIKR